MGTVLTAALSRADLALQSSLGLRISLWVVMLLIILYTAYSSEMLTRKLQGTKDNAAHGRALHRTRIRQYAWRRSLAAALGIIVPGIILSVLMLFPKTLIDPKYEPALLCPGMQSCDNTGLAFAFIADQTTKGAFSDFGEVFQLGVGGYTLDQTRFPTRALVSVYRLILNVYGLTALFLLGRVLIDWMFMGIPIGWSKERKRYLNLSGLSRGEPFSGYADELGEVGILELPTPGRA